MHPARTSRRPQARTEATKAKILDAAQSLFSERGFENTQLDEVAMRAGCSRGAIYAHYKNKEDLFLALMQHRVSTTFKAAWKEIEQESDLKERQNIFKRWLIHQVCGPQAGTLTLEFKLYAVRHPAKRDELLGMYNSLFAENGKDPLEILFGKGLTKAERKAIEPRLAAVGAAVSALILERYFRPELLTSGHLERFTVEIFDALIHGDRLSTT